MVRVILGVSDLSEFAVFTSFIHARGSCSAILPSLSTPTVPFWPALLSSHQAADKLHSWSLIWKAMRAIRLAALH